MLSWRACGARVGVSRAGCRAGGGGQRRDQYRELPQHRPALRFHAAGFFLGALGVALILLAVQDRPPACWYEGKAYSLGAVATMAVDVQMACTFIAGEPAWARDKTGDGMAPGP